MLQPADPSLPKTSAHDRIERRESTRPASVKSESLFEGASELLIDHRGVMYRLRKTSLGKLILTK